MVAVIVWTSVALVVAAAVLVMASVAEGRADEGGVRGYVADVRTGLRTWRASRGKDADRRPAPPATPVDTSIDEFFAATEVHDPAYVAVEDLTGTLARVRERAARGVSGLTRR